MFPLFKPSYEYCYNRKHFCVLGLYWRKKMLKLTAIRRYYRSYKIDSLHYNGFLNLKFFHAVLIDEQYVQLKWAGENLVI